MITLTHLQQSLEREMPLCSWRCHRASNAATMTATGIPSEIEITAEFAGKPVPGSPFHLRGATLVRWGPDAAARLVCSGLPEWQERLRKRAHTSWDKLAEV